MSDLTVNDLNYLKKYRAYVKNTKKRIIRTEKELVASKKELEQHTNEFQQKIDEGTISQVSRMHKMKISDGVGSGK